MKRKRKTRPGAMAWAGLPPDADECFVGVAWKPDDAATVRDLMLGHTHWGLAYFLSEERRVRMVCDVVIRLMAKGASPDLEFFRVCVRLSRHRGILADVVGLLFIRRSDLSAAEIVQAASQRGFDAVLEPDGKGLVSLSGSYARSLLTTLQILTLSATAEEAEGEVEQFISRARQARKEAENDAQVRIRDDPARPSAGDRG